MSPVTKWRLILHLGQHKTGSKALQSFLSHNSRLLARQGLVYPVGHADPLGITAYNNSHYRLFALLRHEAMLACNHTEEAGAFWQAVRLHCHPYTRAGELLESLLREAESSSVHTLLLSAEDLFDMHSAHEPLFRPEWLKAGVRILAELTESLHLETLLVVYLRRQDHLLAAHYAQFIKGPGNHHMSFDDFRLNFAPRLDSFGLLDVWAREFGDERLRVRAYEAELMSGGIVGDFFSLIPEFELPVDALPPPPFDAETVNKSPSRDAIELIRALNGLAARGWPILPRAALLAAVFEGSGADENCGIGAWMSPAERRALLDCHTEGNARIGVRFCGESEHQLFSEPVPVDDANYKVYPGPRPGCLVNLCLSCLYVLLVSGLENLRAGFRRSTLTGKSETGSCKPSCCKH